MKKIVAIFALLFCFNSFSEILTVPIPGAPGLSVTVGTGNNALPLQYINQNPSAVNITQGDDSFTEVPLGFNFPFFGKTFSTSWAMTNGMVTFQDPTVSGIWGACCSGIDLSTTRDTRWNYSIFAVHSDLYSWNGQNQWYLREKDQMTYGWYNVSQCCGSQGGNNFEIKINSAGLVDTRIAGALVQWNAVTSGMSGDLSKGEYYQYYHGQGINIPMGSGFSWQALNGTGTDVCLTNPLSSPACPNYAAAYMTQQCTISALYNPSCPGYAQAYFTQQCSLNSLYDVNCPGYAQAYLDYQCSLDPLYSTTCLGYEKAYHDQQCTKDALYAKDCPGYAEAYFSQQCSLDGLYSQNCTNYAEAYAKKMLLQQQGVNTTPTAIVPVATTTTTVTSTPITSTTGEVKVSVVADQNVNAVITSTATSASPAQTATATVPLVQAPTTTTTTTTVASTTVEKKVEDKPTASTSTTQNTQTNNTENKTENKPTPRQELQAKREAAAKAKAVEDGKNMASNMGKVEDIEQQKAIQNVVLQAMGFTPGFDAYGKVFVPDAVGYRPFTVYNNQKNVDNRTLGFGLYGPSDKLHNELVNSQYK